MSKVVLFDVDDTFIVAVYRYPEDLLQNYERSLLAA